MFGSQSGVVQFSIYSILPIIIILFYIYKRDRFPEPPRMVFMTFLLGVSTIFPISLLIPAVEGFGENLQLYGEAEHFYFAFIRAAFLEELAKWIVLIFFCVKAKEFNEPMDALVYGVAVSLGFAAYENWEYVLNPIYLDNDYQEAGVIAIIRSFSAIPLHALAGIFMGFFLIDTIFNKDNRKLNLFLSLFFPVCLHGFYNHLLMSPNFSYQWTLVLLIVMGIRAFYIFRKESKKQKKQLYEGGFEIFEIKNSDIILVSCISLFLLSIALFLLLKI